MNSKYGQYQSITTAIGRGALRMAVDYRPGAQVEYVALMVLAGSRDDPAGLPGLAHLVEHTIFKGTSARRSSAIINTMERVGGDLNAYTTKDHTAIYSAFPAGYARRAAGLIADLVTDSQFPAAELEKEREVVIDEINSYLDIPAENIFDEFEDAAFAGTPLGHNILGTEQSVRRITSDDCRTYLRRLYRAPNAVAVYSGGMKPEKAFALLDSCFGALSHDAPERAAGEVAGVTHFNQRRDLGLHQANVVMGAEGVSLHDSARYAFSLVINMLGGPSMNSRLNMSLREKRGLVYSVESWLNLYADTGLAAIYFGCDKEDVERCMRLVNREIGLMATRPLSPRALDMAKRQYIGQMKVSTDNRENYLLGMARQLLHYGRVTPTDVAASHIRAIEADDVLRAASRLADMSVLIME